MQSVCGLTLNADTTNATGLAADDRRVTLGPGVTVRMPRMAVGTFGIRHTPSLAAYGGGSTVCIISDVAHWYTGIETHAGTVNAIMNHKNRPNLEYAAGRAKDGSTSGSFSQWSRAFFQRLVNESTSWQQEYTKKTDAPHTKLWVFLRLAGEDHLYLCFGRYHANKLLRPDLLQMVPVEMPFAGTLAMDHLATVSERFRQALASDAEPSSTAHDDDDDSDDEESQPLVNRLHQLRQNRRVRQRRA